MAGIEGLHHVTPIAGEPQPNINFYTTVMELYEKMLTLYPSRVNPRLLWATARAVKPQ